MKTMQKVEVADYGTPDEVRTFDKGRAEILGSAAWR